MAILTVCLVEGLLGDPLVLLHGTFEVEGRVVVGTHLLGLGLGLGLGQWAGARAGARVIVRVVVRAVVRVIVRVIAGSGLGVGGAGPHV